jgi:hypothetical protein
VVEANQKQIQLIISEIDLAEAASKEEVNNGEKGI